MGGQVCCDASTSLQHKYFRTVKTSSEQCLDFFIKHPNIQKIVNQLSIIQNQYAKFEGLKVSQSIASQTVIATDKGIYIGELDKNKFPNNQKTQRSKMLYNQGFYYEGQMKMGTRHGTGILINQDGQYYIGSWLKNQPSGKGIYKSQNAKRSYKGEWLNCLQHGVGFQTYEDGSNYQGQFFQGQKHGKGKLTYPDGTYYEGKFINNVIDGFGVSLGLSHKYQGQWKQGKMHGTGKSQWYNSSGDIICQYIGQYQNGLKHGFGQYRWQNKLTYKGSWEDGELKNQGVLINYQN